MAIETLIKKISEARALLDHLLILIILYGMRVTLSSDIIGNGLGLINSQTKPLSSINPALLDVT